MFKIYLSVFLACIPCYGSEINTKITDLSHLKTTDTAQGSREPFATQTISLEVGGDQRRVVDSPLFQLHPHHTKEEDLFDKKKYIKLHIESLIDKEKGYNTCYKCCLISNIGWISLSGLASVSTVIMSAMGAAEFIEPKIANVGATILATFGGFCVWAASQSKKTSHQYYKAKHNIQSSLGVPRELREPELKLNIQPMEKNQSQTDIANTSVHTDETK